MVIIGHENGKIVRLICLVHKMSHQVQSKIFFKTINLLYITKTRLFKYIENFTSKKIENFQIKTLIFFIFLLKTDCEYSLEPPRRGDSNEYPQSMFLSRNIMYTPVNPSFTI